MTYKVASNVISNLFEDAIPEKTIEEAKEIAIKCIEKQIPMKPIARNHFEPNLYEDYEYYLLHCPVCGSEVAFSEIDDFETDIISNFCQECGQSISKEYIWDWEVEHE